MYLDYFGLKKPPFGITPDTSLFFKGAERGDVLDAILYALDSGQGIIKVVGEVGSGKTMLSRMLTNRASDNTVFVFMLNPSIQAEQVLYAIAYDLGLQVDANDKSIQILHVLQEKLFELYTTGKKVVLVIDEAQQMPLSTLEEIRLLSNLETETEKLLQIILFGQPELDEHIDTPSVRQLRERITYSFYLSPLGWQVADRYLHFRLERAGHQGRAIFNLGAIKLLTKYADGTLRRLNVLADKSLLAAFLQKSPVVETKHVKLALKDNIKGHKKSAVWHYVFLSVLFAAATFSVAYYFFQAADDVAPVKLTATAVDVGKPLEGVKKSPLINDVEPVVVKTKAVQHQNSKQPLQARIQAFENWRKNTNNAYTIRLMLAPSGSGDQVGNFIHTASKQLDNNQLFIKKTEKGEYIVYYKGFSGYSQANLELKKLSGSMSKFQPYIIKLKRLGVS